MTDIIDVFLMNAKANAKRYCNSINAASQVVLRFSLERKRSEEVSCGGRSKWKGDKQVKMKKNIYPGTKKKKDRRVPLLRRRRFLYIQLLLRRVVPLALAPLSSEHRKRVPKHAPPPPPCADVYSSTLPTSPHRRPPPRSKMKIGWCSREIRGGRARLGGGRRSSRSRELSAACVYVRVCVNVMYASIPLVDYRRYFNACHSCADVFRCLSEIKWMVIFTWCKDHSYTIQLLQQFNLWNKIYN